MMHIRTQVGDATSPRPDDKGVIIAHEGKWGAGFVLAVSKVCAAPEAAYRSLARGFSGANIPLGQTQFVETHIPRYIVANTLSVGRRGG